MRCEHQSQYLAWEVPVSTTTAAASSIEVKPFAKRRQHALDTRLQCPPDKSVTHRSVMFAAMAEGRSLILDPLLGADCRSTMGVFRALGVNIREVSPPAQSGAGFALEVDSPGWSGWRSPLVPLDYGNSGTTARLLTGVFAASDGLFVTAFGDASLSQRPMARVVEPLRAQGAEIMGRDGGKLLPMAIRGRQLTPRASLVDKASAQVKSALLLAGLRCQGTTSVSLPAGGRDHTERMLRSMGAKIEVQQDLRAGVRHETITLVGPMTPRAGQYRIPGDPSSAAFLAAIAALASGSITISGVLDNPTRSGFVTVLRRLGVKIELGPIDPNAGSLETMRDMLVLGGSSLRGADFEAELAPSMIDEIPILAVVAAFAQGASRFRGLGELRVKESDRLSKTLELLHLAGAKAHAEGDDLIVAGGLNRAEAFHYQPDYDHRLAMAASVLAKFAAGPCRIDEPECVTVSFPGYFDVLATLG